MTLLEIRFKMSDWKVNTKLRKTLEAQFQLQMTLSGLTARPYELIGNSTGEALGTQNVTVS